MGIFLITLQNSLVDLIVLWNKQSFAPKHMTKNFIGQPDCLSQIIRTSVKTGSPDRSRRDIQNPVSRTLLFQLDIDVFDKTTKRGFGCSVHRKKRR